jgi:hypothetical protein
MVATVPFDTVVPTLLVVDAANVMGSRPDGWWRDRAGAAARLRERLEVRPEEVVLVVEGEARGIAGTDGVEVVEAAGEGDDTIVDVVRLRGRGRPTIVVTADRGLRERVTALGAEVRGPRWLTDGDEEAGTRT